MVIDVMSVMSINVYCTMNSSRFKSLRFETRLQTMQRKRKEIGATGQFQRSLKPQHFHVDSCWSLSTLVKNMLKPQIYFIVQHSPCAESSLDILFVLANNWVAGAALRLWLPQEWSIWGMGWGQRSRPCSVIQPIPS
jgi:hypothetical protein